MTDYRLTSLPGQLLLPFILAERTASAFDGHMTLAEGVFARRADHPSYDPPALGGLLA